MVGLLSQVHRPAVAQGQGAQARTGHARLHSRGVPKSEYWAVPERRASAAGLLADQRAGAVAAGSRFLLFPFEVWLKSYVDKLPAAPEEAPVEKTPSEAMRTSLEPYC